MPGKDFAAAFAARPEKTHTVGRFLPPKPATDSRNIIPVNPLHKGLNKVCEKKIGGSRRDSPQRHKEEHYSIVEFFELLEEALISSFQRKHALM